MLQPTSARKRKAPLELANGRLFRAAIDFCAADTDVQVARLEYREFIDAHGGGVDRICCMRWKNRYDDESEEMEPLPESKWCAACLRYVRAVEDRMDPLWRRRSAKARMKRAYKIILAEHATS